MSKKMRNIAGKDLIANLLIVLSGGQTFDGFDEIAASGRFGRALSQREELSLGQETGGYHAEKAMPSFLD